MVLNVKSAIIYTRVSTDEQARNGLSLQGQENEAKAYCARDNIKVLEVFCDAGESAKSSNRPNLIKAVEYCNANKGNSPFTYIKPALV